MLSRRAVIAYYAVLMFVFILPCNWRDGTAGLQYEFSTILLTRPDRHVDEYWVSLRFRKRTEREWLYYEIAPEVAFEDMYGFKANPGIRFTLEIYYGGKGPSQY